MSHYQSPAIQSLLDAHCVCPQVVVETGTLQGETTRKMSGMFRQVYTIEITREFHDAVSPLIESLGNTESILGDSAVVVPQLCRSIHEPVLWYLDAHWFPGRPASGQDMSRSNPFPLWDELDAIAAREYPDIVMVDDVHAFGREDWGNNPPAGVVQCWANLDEEAIVERLQRVKESLIAMDKVVCYLEKEGVRGVGSDRKSVV